MSGIDEFRETDLSPQCSIPTGVAVATGFDLVVVTATVDGKAGDWGPSRSITPEPTPAVGATRPFATPSAELAVQIVRWWTDHWVREENLLKVLIVTRSAEP